jgi:aspartate dehydrogenase
MMKKQRKIRVGFIGCGAIGSRLAKSVKNDLKNHCQITGFYDLIPKKTQHLVKTLKLNSSLNKKSIDSLIHSCDFIVEAIASGQTTAIIEKVIRAKKGILIMSVGKALNIPHIFKVAEKNHTMALIPSGAIGGLDVIKSIDPKDISKITLTTRKPPSSLEQSDYLTKKKIYIDHIKKETVLFDGGVQESVKLFPRNINVAAALALASRAQNKIRIRIITSPKFTLNSHEINVWGKFGHLSVRTDNEPCPDNRKTSYLAVLSAIQTLKQYFNSVKIGT